MAAHEHHVAPSAVTIGESLGVIIATGTGLTVVGSPATVSCAGAEGNVAIGLARLGHQGRSLITQINSPTRLK